ncbi:TPA: alanine dehydrogenase [Candidatus Bathyarchaeota archaeon]|nr:alanine dehydrogenase [Candidatus Bathyarchaeota archaeon]
MRVLLLTEREIKPLLLMSEVMEAVETAFKEKALGYVQMPPKIYITYDRYNGDLRAMPSYLERLGVSAVKIVNSHPDNPKKFKLPTVMATIVLVDPKNGAPLAIMSGTWITAMRTGAAGGIAAKYLARKDSKVIGLVGAGTQAKTQLMALLSLYEKLEEVRVWSRSEDRRKEYVSEMEPLCRGKTGILPVESVKDAVIDADIIVTTTPSRKPLVSDEWISEGTHITCIGADAPGKEELDPSILLRAKIYVDDWEQGSHSGEINVPLARGMITKENVYGELGEAVAGFKPRRISAEEITVFTSTGLAVQDVVTAKLAYEKALANDIGEWIEMF